MEATATRAASLLPFRASTGSSAAPVVHHPEAWLRIQASTWSQYQGIWMPGPESTGYWELVCVDCGDDGGPWEQQTPEVRAIRGPYTYVDGSIVLKQHRTGTIESALKVG